MAQNVWIAPQKQRTFDWLKISQFLVGPGLVVLGLALYFIEFKPSRPSRPNIVWIVIDSLRADHLGAYGYGRNTSPFLDDLAVKNIFFRNAYSQESYTQASAASYFTSTYPWVHRVLYNEPKIDVLDYRFVTIAEVLKKAGYTTAAFVGSPDLNKRFNFGRGFDEYMDAFKTSTPKTAATHDTASRIGERLKRYFMWHSKKAPYFLYLHYGDTRKPYLPFAPYDTMFSQDAVPASFDYIPPNRQEVMSDIDRYDGEIRYVDEKIRKLFQLLGQRGIDRYNTVFIITADHGEEFLDPHPSDAGGRGNNRTLYNELIHVPMIMSIPQVDPGIVSWPVGLIDIAPTLCDIAHIDPKKYNARFQGRSFLSSIKVGMDDDAEVFGGGRYDRGYLIRNGLKYYVDLQPKVSRRKRPSAGADFEMREEMYDLYSDYHELHNIIAENPKPAVELAEDLKIMKNKQVLYKGNAVPVLPDDVMKQELLLLGDSD